MNESLIPLVRGAMARAVALGGKPARWVIGNEFARQWKESALLIGSIVTPPHNDSEIVTIAGLPVEVRQCGNNEPSIYAQLRDIDDNVIMQLRVPS